MSGFLSDTNVPSELIRPQPEPKVKTWVAAQDPDTLFISSVSFGELRKGIGLRPPVGRSGRSAAAYGAPSQCAQIAATALEHGLTLVRAAKKTSPVPVSFFSTLGMRHDAVQLVVHAATVADGLTVLMPGQGIGLLRFVEVFTVTIRNRNTRAA